MRLLDLWTTSNMKRIQLRATLENGHRRSFWWLEQTNTNNYKYRANNVNIKMAGGKLSSTRVTLLGLFLVALGAVGFHEIPGMIAEGAEGSKLVNSFYCSVMTLTT